MQFLRVSDMGVKVKGISQAKAALDRIIDDVQGRKAVRAIQSAMLIGGAQAAIYTPIDTSVLLKSQFRELDVKGTLITGRVGYSANYAAYVHAMTGKLKGQPRAHFGKTSDGKDFGGGSLTGNYWDPHGEPQFLSKGFSETRDQIDAAVRKELSL